MKATVSPNPIVTEIPRILLVFPEIRMREKRRPRNLCQAPLGAMGSLKVSRGSGKGSLSRSRWSATSRIPMPWTTAD